MREVSGVKIDAISAVVPKNIISNSDPKLAGIFNDKELRRFEKMTGIIERRYVESNITASDLGFNAAKVILEDNKELKKDISTVIWLSQTSDYIIPFTSNILQSKLNLNTDTLCIDISAGCAGFVQGLYTAYCYAKNSNKKVLFIVGETLSKILAKNDRATTPLFGDGAAAILVSPTKKTYDSTIFGFCSDGEKFKAIHIPDGGFKSPACKASFDEIKTEDGVVRNLMNLQMDGSAVFDFTLREIPASINKILEKKKITTSQLDFIALHQSNKLIINQISSMINISKEKVLINISKFGNTSGVSIPLLLVSERERLINKNSKILCSGYGSGLNWGNCIIDLNKNTKIYKLKEI